VIEDEPFQAKLTEWNYDQFIRDWHRSEGEWKERGENAILYVRKVNRGTIGNLEQAIMGMTSLPDDIAMPS